MIRVNICYFFQDWPGRRLCQLEESGVKSWKKLLRKRLSLSFTRSHSKTVLFPFPHIHVGWGRRKVRINPYIPQTNSLAFILNWCVTFSGEFCPKSKRETISLLFVVSIFKIHLINSSMLAILDASSMYIEKSQWVGLDLLKFSFLSFPSAPRKVKLVSHRIKFKYSAPTKLLSTTDFPKIYA